jgi:putative ABC transport system substrate-binding protein
MKGSGRCRWHGGVTVANRERYRWSKKKAREARVLVARPGGNLSGVEYTELDTKRLELLREIMPEAHRVALLRDAAQFAPVEHLTAITAAAQRLAITTEVVEVRRPEQIAETLQQVRAGGAEAVNVLQAPMFFEKGDILAAAAIEAKLPAFCEFVPGCLANYQMDSNEIFRIAGAQLARVLQGAWVAELPVQQAMKFELLINLKTAKKLGLAIPASILARADKVIE